MWSIDGKKLYIVSGILMFISAVFRIIFFMGERYETGYFFSQSVLPVAACAVYIYFIMYYRERPCLFIAPVLMGVAFFALKSLTFDSVLHTVLCLILYVSVGILVIATLIGIVKTKIPLLLIIGLPFVYHIAVEDSQKIIKGTYKCFRDTMPEISVLLIMASLFLFTLSLKKKNKVIEERNETQP